MTKCSMRPSDRRSGASALFGRLPAELVGGAEKMSAVANTTESVHEQVILANKEFYRQIASKYDHYEYCASDAFFQNVIEQDLEIIHCALARRKDPIHCLDCGGGTGNLTLKMLRRGWLVTVVDVSSDMLEILKTKVASARQQAIFINDS